MSEPIYAYPLGEKYRVAVYIDPDAEWYPPYENWESVGIHTLTMSEDNVPIYHTPAGAELISDWLDTHYAGVDVHIGVHSAKLERSMFKHFKALGIEACLCAMSGHLNSQWGIVLLYNTVKESPDVARNKLDNHASELTDWWRGDVYMAQIQKRTVYLADTKKTLIRWERADDVQPNTAGGLYLSGDTDLNNVLRGIGWMDTEHFWENN
jgi:hypothetical protein